MNILLWILQAALAFLCLAGGAYKVFQTDELAKHMRVPSRGGWRALGVLEVVCGVLLILPGVTKWTPVLTPLAATVLALEALVLSVLFGRRYSLKLVATNPLVWSAGMGLAAAFVAYGRYALTPLA